MNLRPPRLSSDDGKPDRFRHLCQFRFYFLQDGSHVNEQEPQSLRTVMSYGMRVLWKKRMRHVPACFSSTADSSQVSSFVPEASFIEPRLMYVIQARWQSDSTWGWVTVHTNILPLSWMT